MADVTQMMFGVPLDSLVDPEAALYAVSAAKDTEAENLAILAATCGETVADIADRLRIAQAELLAAQTRGDFSLARTKLASLLRGIKQEQWAAIVGQLKRRLPQGRAALFSDDPVQAARKALGAVRVDFGKQTDTSVEKEAQQYESPGEFIREYLERLLDIEDDEKFHSALHRLFLWIRERGEKAPASDKEEWKTLAESVFRQTRSRFGSASWCQRLFSIAADIFNYKPISFPPAILPELLKGEHALFHLSSQTTFRGERHITPLTRLTDFPSGTLFRFRLVETVTGALELRLGDPHLPHRYLNEPDEFPMAYGDLRFLPPNRFQANVWNIGVPGLHGKVSIDFMRILLKALYGDSVEVEELN